jgi:hypothetical protein
LVEVIIHNGGGADIGVFPDLTDGGREAVLILEALEELKDPFMPFSQTCFFTCHHSGSFVEIALLF